MLDALFSPRSVAVIGASSNPDKLGNIVLDNIVKSGFVGDVYPINPKSSKILELEAYPSVLDTPDPLDLAVIVVPNRYVANVLRQSGEKGVQAAIVITAGFREAGAEGRQMERELIEIARDYNIRMVGPNCLGVIDTGSSLNASFAAGMPTEGTISFMSQSGALCTGILDWAALNGLGFASFVSLGNKADLNETHFLQEWMDDDNTSVVMAYLEGVVNGTDFIQTSQALTKKKPFVVVKSGTTAAGSRAVSSHTGTLAGSDTAYDTAFQQAGVIRAESVGDLFALSTALAYQPLPDGNRVAIITNAGGPGIMATDACEKMGIELAQLELGTVEFLMDVLPPAANHHNPIDVLGDARSDRYQPALEAAVKDTNVDAVIFLLTPQAMTDIKEIAQGVVKVAGLSNKPILACFMGGKEVAAGNKVLAAGCVPFYDFPENAAKALKGMIDQKLWMETPVDKPTFIEVDTSPARKTLERCRTAGRLKLNEMEAREIVAAYGIPLPKAKLASNPKQVAESAEEIGFPLVMKIISPDILHKSDMGGVIVGISSEQEALNAYQEIMLRARRYSPDADIWGVAVQEMVTPGRETIIGVSEDPTFGHMVMFGIGGIYVEVIKDVQFGITPLSEKHARSMITELRSYPLLEGVRGEKASDMDAMVDCLLRISQMVVDFPEIVELDINPLFVYPEGQGVMAVDARIVIAAE